MIEWYKTPETTKRNAYIQIAEAMGMSPVAVEKDWWVVQTLRLLFQSEAGKGVIFKGGTSLSKSWNLIERFSEDIDLTLDWSLFDFDGKPGRSNRGRLRKKFNLYVENSFYPQLLKAFQSAALNDVQVELVETTESDADPRIIMIYYPHVLQSNYASYIEPAIKIELGCRSLLEPYTLRPVQSFLDSYFANKSFVQPEVLVPSVNPERTFLEKVFLLHERFQEGNTEDVEEKLNKQSRHLYDLYKLSYSEYFERALNDKTLYESIVKHRFYFTKISRVDYRLHQPKAINPVPQEDVLKAWEKDYAKMQEMVYGKPIDFDELISRIQFIKERLHQTEWDIDTNYMK